MRLVLIEWQNSHADGSWCQIANGMEERALVCLSVGWLVLDVENANFIAPHINEREAGVPPQACGVMTIPARAVLRITELTQHSASDTGITCRSSSAYPGCA